MSTQTIYIMMGIIVGIFAIIVIAYLILRKKMQGSEYKKIMELQSGTKSNGFSTEVMYQRLYLFYRNIPFVKRYLLKLRRRLEILNIDDEYKTRRDSARILTRALLILIPLVIFTIVLTKSNGILMVILLLFEVFMIDLIIEGSVDKKDDQLLEEQVDFFGEIRHAYHEYNMVEEAIYQVSQDDEKDVSRQGEKIYEILISDDPETELEKYYDIAPNNYLKEFAGISYLTKEFGDRKVDGASLYLKNVDNITQEMQIEILKRDKLNYVFRSLSFISIVPVLFMEPLKRWAVSNFSFVKSWYYGKSGTIVQIVLLILTFVCYILVRKLKDNNSVNLNTKNTENPWQQKVYKNKLGKKIVDLFLPKDGTKEYRNLQDLLKEAASPLKMEWVYVNRICLAIVVFIVSLCAFVYLHKVEVNYIYTEATSDYNLLGEMSDTEEKRAMQTTRRHDYYLDIFKGKLSTQQSDIEKEMKKKKKISAETAKKYNEIKGVSESGQKIDFVKEMDDYNSSVTDEEIKADAEKVYDKLQKINGEYLKWFELLLSFVFMVVGYIAPILMLKFQARMRKMDMEDEVMQFQTIILMLMRIERVNVEIILEWLERYSNIFKSQITKCVNNYEAGAWEALEELKNDVSYLPFIRIIESLQAAVEKIPIRDAFDELDSEREYYRDKRKESNDRLIKRKELIGRVIGFAPMVCLFIFYLIVPLVFIGLLSMNNTFTSMENMT